MSTEYVVVPLDAEAMQAVKACMDAIIADEREPERYREWYGEVRALLDQAVPVEPRRDPRGVTNWTEAES